MSLLSKALRPRSVTILPKAPKPDTLKAYAIVSTELPFKEKFQLDTTTSQRHTREMISTQNPVEAGFTVTNHVRRTNDIIEITGILTDTPIGLALLNVKETFAGIYKNLALQNYKKLDDLFLKKEPVYVATSFRTYDSMLIKSLSITKQTGTGYALEVSIRLEEIMIRSPLSVPAILDLDGLLLGGGQETNIGTQTLQPSAIPGV